MTPENACGMGTPSYKETHIYGYYLSVYPNPASDEITLTLNNRGYNSEEKEDDESFGNKKYTIIIHNNQGNQVLKVYRSRRSFRIPFNHLRNGNYIIELYDGKKIYRNNLIINH